MTGAEQLGQPDAIMAAPEGGIFLGPAFDIHPSLIERIHNADATEAGASQARTELHEFYKEHDLKALEVIAQKRFSGVGHLRPDQLEPLHRQHVLEDKAGGYVDLVSTVNAVSDNIAAALVEHFGREEPGALTLIGHNWYRTSPIDNRGMWLTRDDGGDSATTVFGRYEDFIIPEDGTDPMVRNASPRDHMLLILDVVAEQMRAGKQDKVPTDPVERPSVTENTHPDSVAEYPFKSDIMAAVSTKFYDDYEDLLPSGVGMVAQVGWHKQEGIAPIPDHRTDGGVDTITVAFDAREYLPKAALRIDDKGRHYPGPGDFAWQLTRNSHGGRTVSGFRVVGSLVQPLPTGRFDRSGRLLSTVMPDAHDIAESWRIIDKLIQEGVVAEKAAFLRGQIAQREVVPVDVRTQRVLEQLGRLDLLDGPEVRKPKKTAMDNIGAIGFKGALYTFKVPGETNEVSSSDEPALDELAPNALNPETPEDTRLERAKALWLRFFRTRLS